MKWILLICITGLTPFGYATSESSYKNVIKNYFTKRKKNTSTFYGSPRSLTLFTGASLYGETKDEKQKPLSSYTFGFNQRIKEYTAIGDLNLKIELHSVALETQRSTQVTITPHFSLPDIRSGFPIYVGFGAGFGLFPRHILKKQPALSFNVQMYTGLRLIDIYKNFGLITELNLRMRTPFQDMKLYMELLMNVGFVFSF